MLAVERRNVNIRGFYEAQAEVRQTGREIDGRVRKAGKLFLRYRVRAERVLDIGCGVGEVGLYLKGLLGAREAWGLELSRGRAAAAQARGVKAVLCDLNQEALPFKKDSFDAIFCGEVIEHLVDPDHLLDEIERVLTSGGVCVLTTPNLACWFNRIALLLGWQPFATSVSFRHEVGRPKVFVGDYGCRDHLRVFTFRALRELLEAKGFRILEVKGCSLSDLISSTSEWKKKQLRDIVYRMVSPVDYLMARNPSLAAGLAVAFDKG